MDKSNLNDFLLSLTPDSEATKKILNYIDNQHGPKNKVVLHIEMGQIINVLLSIEEGDTLLAHIFSYSEHYRNKVIELIGS